MEAVTRSRCFFSASSRCCSPTRFSGCRMCCRSTRKRLAALSEHLSFNTAASFTTNTNWQNYGGETTMSYLSQMVGLACHNFVSAAVGIAIAAAFVRGIARHTSRTIGNFWVDLTRVTYYLLLPICLIFAVVLVSQGMIQNFKPYDTVKLTEPFTTQVAKVDDKGNPVLDPAGQTGDGRQEDRHPNDRARSDGFADRDQNAGNKWRRLCRTRTPRIRTKTQLRFPTFSRSCRSSRSRAR